MLRPPPPSTLFPYTTLFRSLHISSKRRLCDTTRPSRSTTRMPSAVDSSVDWRTETVSESAVLRGFFALEGGRFVGLERRSEEHTSELQSHSDLVCRLLLEKK